MKDSKRKVRKFMAERDWLKKIQGDQEGAPRENVEFTTSENMLVFVTEHLPKVKYEYKLRKC